ncbi:MAG: hypothetical protein WCQ99_01440 [Pseudomonadota bacterium]
MTENFITTLKKQANDSYSHVSAILRLRGIKQKDIASELNISQSMVARVLNGWAKGQRVRLHISKKLNIDVNKLFPPHKVKHERYM